MAYIISTIDQRCRFISVIKEHQDQIWTHLKNALQICSLYRNEVGRVYYIAYIIPDNYVHKFKGESTYTNPYLTL